MREERGVLAHGGQAKAAHSALQEKLKVQSQAQIKKGEEKSEAHQVLLAKQAKVGSNIMPKRGEQFAIHLQPIQDKKLGAEKQT